MTIVLAARAGTVFRRCLGMFARCVLCRVTSKQLCNVCDPHTESGANPRSVALVMVDVSGYTQFIRFNKTSLAHAQEIISQLIESVIDKASYPLTLNKLEGDAAFLYAELGENQTAMLHDIVAQVNGFFGAFHAKALELSGSRASCPCEACQRIRDLQLKAVVHRGKAAFRKIRQFEELAGEDVILVHRLLKNSVSEREYILLTEPIYQLLGYLPPMPVTPHVETYKDLGNVNLKVLFPTAAPHIAQRRSTLRVTGM